MRRGIALALVLGSKKTPALHIYYIICIHIKAEGKGYDSKMWPAFGKCGPMWSVGDMNTSSHSLEHEDGPTQNWKPRGWV